MKWAGVCARFLLRMGLLLLVAAGSVACYALAARSADRLEEGA